MSLCNPKSMFLSVINMASDRSITAHLAPVSSKDFIQLAFCADNNNAGSTITNNNNGPPQLTFTVALVPADASKAKLQGGVVAQKIAESAAGAGNLAQSITPGATFGPAVFYIDQSQQGLPKKANTKWGWGGWASLLLCRVCCIIGTAAMFCGLTEDTTFSLRAKEWVVQFCTSSRALAR